MLILGPPLRGGLWTAVYDPAMTRGHRRVVYATEGAARIPGRFAIDWFRVDEQGRMARGDGARVDQHFGHGAEVIAVADGVVVATRDDMAEPETLAAARRVPIGDAAGNYVAIDIGGVYAFYEHLRPGLAVRPGERVRRGELIGRLGFTGQASSPHLHFHLADAPSPLGAEGLAYLIQGIEPIGRFDSIEAFGRGDGWTPLPPRPGSDRPYFPTANMVVRFPER
jgi:murein DD-endopeptidase MepM/ murein hydrolase activator NlpD